MDSRHRFNHPPGPTASPLRSWTHDIASIALQARPPTRCAPGLTTSLQSPSRPDRQPAALLDSRHRFNLPPGPTASPLRSWTHDIASIALQARPPARCALGLTTSLQSPSRPCALGLTRPDRQPAALLDSRHRFNHPPGPTASPLRSWTHDIASITLQARPPARCAPGLTTSLQSPSRPDRQPAALLDSRHRFNRPPGPTASPLRSWTHDIASIALQARPPARCAPGLTRPDRQPAALLDSRHRFNRPPGPTASPLRYWTHDIPSIQPGKKKKKKKKKYKTTQKTQKNPPPICWKSPDTARGKKKKIQNHPKKFGRYVGGRQTPPTFMVCPGGGGGGGGGGNPKPPKKIRLIRWRSPDSAHFHGKKKSCCTFFFLSVSFFYTACLLACLLACSLACLLAHL